MAGPTFLNKGDSSGSGTGTVLLVVVALVALGGFVIIKSGLFSSGFLDINGKPETPTIGAPTSGEAKSP